MDNQYIFVQLFQDVLQANTNCVRLDITASVDSFRALIPTTYEEINTFVCSYQYSNSARAMLYSILIGTRVYTSIKFIMFELKLHYLCSAISDEDTTNAIGVGKINII